MKILVICAGDRSQYSIALESIKYLKNTKLDTLTVCVLDNNKKIVKFLKKNKVKFVSKNFGSFFKKIKKNEYNWLLNIWGFKILKKDFLNKFKNNLNLHPSYLPYNRGRDPYYFSIINNTPIGICIHRMDQTIDAGKYYLRKKFNLKFPVTAGKIFNLCLKNIRDMFIKNWIKIRNHRIKLKNFSQKISQLNKRKDFIQSNFIDLDKKNNKKEKSFVMNSIAQDFDFLKLQIKLFGKIYDCKLILKKTKKKRGKIL